MSTDPRVALQALVASFEEHLSAVSSRRGDDDPAVESAAYRMMDAFEEYEDSLYDTYGEVTPLDVYDDSDDDDLDDDDDDGPDLDDSDDEDDASETDDRR
ncbi:MAG: hypothetical protein ACTHWW_07350 [Arthrobacter sp.]|uniref:hypothetical protein n=1 Tax=unclassified Arthrobacter TaxID=235627 RepID=UPI00265666A9|nr:hypothetical protein [Micrococcaceae bacterium]MDN5824691.1 hypothetical protein [Micrococcaceae bacterium]MDN5878247.1 hypothetical protein [Micrococcaceae bacterium]MDN5885759.1 hypothetical protein [Micrococcaceae bacterium]MDN5906586.1 hypothetical protein [Micrococcaceae bacterium]